jgi:hypothetical protein
MQSEPTDYGGVERVQVEVAYQHEPPWTTAFNTLEVFNEKVNPRFVVCILPVELAGQMDAREKKRGSCRRANLSDCHPISDLCEEVNNGGRGQPREEL